MRDVCDLPFGAVIPLLRPSWLIPVLATTASASAPPARPSARNKLTTASPRPYPSADASNVLHLPDSERADIWQMLMVVVPIALG